jgi:hypothetical protein
METDWAENLIPGVEYNGPSRAINTMEAERWGRNRMTAKEKADYRASFMADLGEPISGVTIKSANYGIRKVRARSRRLNVWPLPAGTIVE